MIDMELAPGVGVAVPEVDARGGIAALGVVGAAAVAALGAWAAAEQGSAEWWVAAVVAFGWAVGGALLVKRRPSEPLGLMIVAGALLGATGLAVWSSERDGTAVHLFALLPAVGAHIGLAVPDGRLRSSVRRVAAAAGYGAAAVVASTLGGEMQRGPLVWLSLALSAVAVSGYVTRCRSATGANDRARLQWMGWGVVVAAAIVLAVALLDELLSWPSQPAAVALAATLTIPIGFAASSYERALTHVERVLVHTIVAVGLAAMVGATYLLVIAGLGRVPTGDERSVLALSMLAAAIAAVLAVPVRHRLEEIANQRVYGERHAPDEALRGFGLRMSRAVPMDELLLQLAESLKKTMALQAAEIWTGNDGVLDRTVSVPDRPVRRIVLEGEELGVAARARVQGNAWLQVWLPGLLEGRSDGIVRAASIAHFGELLGFLVVERPIDGAAFTEEEETALVELARQAGLALHNVRLDSALQASLDELKERNLELQASRARIVAASDESRRRIERNLHDGAQQYLVALKVKVGLLKQLLAADPDTAAKLIDELGDDVQTTVDEVRELAHGIYPPLLRDRGIVEALRAAANRSPLPVDLRADVLPRNESEVEAAVYFCCLEAMQNAGKHAGADATITIDLAASASELRFEVSDNGPGFDPNVVEMGHGFVNMRDRLGAIGGQLEVESAPGAGALVRGVVPAHAVSPDGEASVAPPAAPAPDPAVSPAPTSA